MKAPDIKKLRFRMGLTQTEFGEAVGVNQSTISKWEDGAPVSRLGRKVLEALRQRSAAV